nr:aminotransferase class V-fold PLP-dependent enzyme [Patescibacteria group bacterium]
MDENFEFPLEEIKKHFADGVKIFAFTHASNVLGNIYPAKEICRLSREYGVYTVLDGAQAVPHFKVNVQSLDCDFYAFSGHKMLGPSGIGVLYVRRELFEKFSPFKFGGGMIDVVTETDATWAHPPEKYEAGTPNIAGAVGLAAAARYLESIGLDNIREHEIEITKYALQQLQQIPNISILGSKNPENRTGIVSFTIKNIHAHDIASILNVHGVCVRSGHHCTMPLHTSLNLAATVRASYYLYNSTHDIDMLVVGLKKALEILV